MRARCNITIGENQYTGWLLGSNTIRYDGSLPVPIDTVIKVSWEDWDCGCRCMDLRVLAYRYIIGANFTLIEGDQVTLPSSIIKQDTDCGVCKKEE